MKRLCIAAALLATATFAAADDEATTTLRDPWVPPAVRAQAAADAASAAGRASAMSTQAQVQRKLKAGFDAADTQHTGRITKAQAQAAGLGQIAANFERIDAGKRGSVSFEDYLRWLRSRGANNL